MGEFAYVISDWQAGLWKIINISTPDNISIAESFDSSAAFVRAEGMIAAAGDRIYVPTSSGQGGLAALTISENTNLAVVDLIHDPGGNGGFERPRDFAIADDHAYVIQSASVTALSVANPDDPKMVGHIAAMELINEDLIEVAADYAHVITPWCTMVGK